MVTHKSTLGTPGANLAHASARVAKAFFGIHAHDDTLSSTGKVADTVLRRAVYAVADYWLMVASAAFIVLMDTQFSYGPYGLFMLMWAFDIAVANIFVVLWKRTGQDVTLGESYRRAVDAIHDESHHIGYLAFLGVIVKASIWDGPEHIVIFFNKEIKTELRMLIALLVLTALQAAFWTPVYVLGFESGMELFQLVFSAL